jgi:stearoyl-CoA desaturase (delta-9 desaturase)
MRPRKRNRILTSVARWFDDSVSPYDPEDMQSEKVDWLRIVPFIALHLACLGVIWTGWSVTAVATAAGLYFLRMFAITAFYHRYFSHRSFQTSRFWQFLFAALGNAAVQRGPLWWAAHHRHHHKHADLAEDPHSPAQRGFLWSHVGWFTTPKHFPTRTELVGDWMKYPELRFLNRFSIVVPLLMLAALVVAGELLRVYAPGAGTNGLQMAVWGFCISTVVLFHATGTINSLDHMIGRRRFATPDTSRNNWFLALITLGEGWHNNHHHYPASARQGFFWYEIDLTYYMLAVLSRLGIVRNLKPVPERVRGANLISPP